MPASVCLLDTHVGPSRPVSLIANRYGVEGFNCLHDRVDDFKAQFPHYFVRPHSCC